MLQDEVAVEQHGLHFGQEIVVPVQIAPARLHHADLGIGKVMDRARQEIRRRDEIGIEDSDEFAGRGLQTLLQSAGLVAVAIGAVMILDRECPMRWYRSHSASANGCVSSVESSST